MLAVPRERDSILRLVATTPSVRLSHDEAAHLHRFWCEDEASMGHRGICYESLANSSRSGWHDAFDDDLEEATAVHRKTRRILLACPSRGVVVLYRFYGPQRPVPHFAAFGQYAPIAEYTAAVERLSQRLCAPPEVAVPWRMRQPDSVPFVSQVRSNADRLLSAACVDYRMAKRQCFRPS